MDLYMVVPGLSLISHDISYKPRSLIPTAERAHASRIPCIMSGASDFTWSFLDCFDDACS